MPLLVCPLYNSSHFVFCFSCNQYLIGVLYYHGYKKNYCSSILSEVERQITLRDTYYYLSGYF